jgi:hypothetical protein
LRANTAAALASCLILASCATRDAVERRFENGVEVVFNHIQRYRLRGEPSSLRLRKILGIDLEREDLAAKMGAPGEWCADDAGNIYIVCFKTERDFVFKFDSSGRLLRSFGPRGQGPGELQWPFLMGWGREGISLYDKGPNKVIVFGPDGELVREWRPPRQPLFIESLPCGNFVAMNLNRERTTPETFMDELSLWDADGKTVKTLDVFEQPQVEVRQNVRLPRFFMWRVSAGRIFIANEKRGYEILVYDQDGRLVRKIRKEYRPVHVTESIKAAVLGPDYRRSGVSHGKWFPDPLPPLNQFFTDDEGRLFVMTYEAGEHEGEFLWDIFNPDGVFVGRKSLNIMWASLYLGPKYTFVKNGKLYCRHEKESGFQVLAVYQMIWER